MDEQNLGFKIRQFVHDLFGSRLVQQLENDLANLRNDYDRRLQERDETVADLRSQLATTRTKLELYENVLIPLTSPAANLLKPKREVPFELISEPNPNSWAGIQAAWYKKEEDKDGIPESIRQEI